MKYFCLAIILTIGVFSKFTSSELWPITISKSWLEFPNFEYSLVQKPLLTLFLSFIHLLPFNDIVHLVFVKFAFAIIGAFGVYYFVKYILIITKKESYNNTPLVFNTLVLLIFLSSYTFYTNFFNIRSDQLAFSFFSFFLYLTEKNEKKWSLLFLLLIPLTGIKEIIFVPVGVLYYYFKFKTKVERKYKLIAVFTSIAVLVWAVALNIPYLYYFITAIQETNYLNRFDAHFLKNDLYLLIASFIAFITILINKQRQLHKTLLISGYFVLVLLLMPQTYNFFVASIILLILLPLFSLALNINFNNHKKPFIGLFTTILILFIFKISQNHFTINSAFPQYQYISLASKFINKYNFEYLDGVGILPKQKFYKCFVSPFDNEANVNCLKTTHQPDVIIITNRLAYLGDEIFKKVEADYTQIYPNLWVLNSKVHESVLKHTKLNNLPLPIIIFN